jgi:hypothetical protein
MKAKYFAKGRAYDDNVTNIKMLISAEKNPLVIKALISTIEVLEEIKECMANVCMPEELTN